ncbi:hypothetical protein [Leptolyngbya sp. FACHB-261]|uniref:hypothetical protein n=1 Tax=Leptolyngbya sp. FACHB-261 TaxID=2692806 RepID=UPI001686AB11|nr:hypothetical protein [Leptolyngbya sp. FACHB-261]MBD2100686.1 hypothetical protein [Leptolyngbya sp. FACHB-261]
MNTSHLSPSQIRLQLWDHISREIRLPTSSKILLLVIANLTDPRSLRARIPISLLVVHSGQSETEINRLLSTLETKQWIESMRVPNEVRGRPAVTLYNLSAPLLHRALSNNSRT